MVQPRAIVVGLAIAASFVVKAPPAPAADTAPIAGSYLCASGCRATDAPPGIAIDGNVAHCMNEYGGIYAGRLVTRRSVYCFDKTGVLSDDGKTVHWSNGAT